MNDDLKNEKYIVWLYRVSSRTYTTCFNKLSNDYFEVRDIEDFDAFHNLKDIDLLSKPDLLICEDGTKLPLDIKKILEDSCCGVAYVTNKVNERQTENMFNRVYELIDEELTLNVMRGREPVPFTTTKKDLSIKRMIEIAQLANVKKITKIMQKQASIELSNMQVEEEIESGVEISNVRKDFLRKVGNRLNTFIDMKDNYTFGHCQRVAVYSEVLAHGLGMSKDKIEELVLAAELHDIGKLGLPTAVINKTSKLSNEEFEWMKHHTDFGVKIFPDIKCTNLYGGIRSHHEKYDGSGYPDGLVGDQIPFFGQLIAITDSFDAMTSQRSYNKVKSAEEAFEDLIQHKGTWYNPELVDVFVKSMRENKSIMKKLEIAKQEADKKCEEQAKIRQEKENLDKEYTEKSELEKKSKESLDKKLLSFIKGGK